MRQNVSILVTLFLVLFLGIWGQYELSPDRFQDDFSSVFYEVIMLFGLEGDWTRGITLPWQLDAARILAPLVSVAGVLILLTRGAWVGLSNYFIRFKSDHIVVVGLGERGWQFVSTCRGVHDVVVLERNPENSLIERARQSGVAVIVGDVLVEETMHAARIETAKHVVTFCGNDGESVEIALRIREYMLRQDTREQKLRIHLHVNATRVSTRLEQYAKFYDDSKIAEVDFFSVYDLTARILLRNYPPDRFAEVLGKDQVHIAIFGFGTLAEHILTEAVRMCHFKNNSLIRFTIFDLDVSTKTREMLSLHPCLQDMCDIQEIDLPFLHPLQLDVIPDALLQSITEHVICMPNDDQNLELALMLRTILLERRACNAPINVRMQRSTGLAKLLEASEGEPEIPDGIFPFGVLDEVLFYENILTDRMDELAQTIHEDYLTRRMQIQSDQRLYTSLKEWNELPEPQRKSSRLQADHLHAKLRAIRCRYQQQSSNLPVFEFSHEEAKILAQMEHARWTANNIYEGWRQGQERIEGAKINPYNVPWDALQPSDQKEEIDAILSLPSLLKDKLGWEIQREYYIGVTGHRPDRIDTNEKLLLEQINSVLGEIAEEHKDKRLILVSPLAEGADRMFARAALARFGFELHVPLPLPYELYQTDFPTRESLQEFKELVGKAETYFEMPTLFGDVETLASRVDGRPNELRNQQYALVGAYIAQTCDELVAIHDGGPAQGTGGTAQILAWRREGIPQAYQFSTAFSTRPSLQAPRIIPVTTRV